MSVAGVPSAALSASRVTDARRAAAHVLADLRGGHLLDVAFEEHARALDGRDRRWSQELVYGMLRRRAWIDMLLGQCVRGGLARLDPDLTDLLRLGAYQLLHMGSVPAYAAIAQTVELAKGRGGLGASKLANAVLRRLDRERATLARPEPTDPIAALALRHSHPRWLVARWVARWGATATESLLAANNLEAPLVVRPWGVVREQLEAMLETSAVGVDDAPLVADSLTITLGGALTDLGAFRQGHLFVQDPAATLVTRYASFEPGSTVARRANREIVAKSCPRAKRGDTISPNLSQCRPAGGCAPSPCNHVPCPIMGRCERHIFRLRQHSVVDRRHR